MSDVAKVEVTGCRQHWLRFSWQNTWAAQGKAGIKFDTTLMFNDRPGFRSSAALAWYPWDSELNRSHTVKTCPSILMDSHLYDYRPMSDLERNLVIQDWLSRVGRVNGAVALLWHPHTLTEDYGWGKGFEHLLETKREIGVC